MFEAPLTFTEAEAMLSARLDTPTALKYKEIAATWDADFRHRAFFSARVTEATVLSELHNRVQAVLDGKMTDKQAVALLRDYFVGPGADPLAKMGFAPKAGARTIAELASLPRLQLIVETNVRMAQECGHYQQWAESAAFYRYGIWRCGYAEEHREEHLARDGKVYAFDHPIWTQSPPGGEFNCHCYREIASEDEIRALGLTPEPPSSPFEPSSLGFDPSRGMADPPPFGKRVRPEYREKAQEKIDDLLAGGETAVGPAAVPEEEDVRTLPVKEALAKKADLVKEIRDKTKAAVEENARRSDALLQEYTDITARIKEAKDGASSPSVLPDDVLEKIRGLQIDREKINKRLDENISRRYLDVSQGLSIPKSDRIETVIAMPARSVVRAPVNEAKAIVENLTSKKVGLSRTGFSARGRAPKGRSWFYPQENAVYIRSDAGVPTAVHEMAHWVENSSPHVHKRCVEFLEYRCAGETPEKLSDLTGNKRFKPYEVARKDKFFNPYCGKDYIDKNGKRIATEILSMGIQQILDKPLQFLQEDPEYFAFVTLLLRGAI